MLDAPLVLRERFADLRIAQKVANLGRRHSDPKAGEHVAASRSPSRSAPGDRQQDDTRQQETIAHRIIGSSLPIDRRSLAQVPQLRMVG